MAFKMDTSAIEPVKDYVIKSKENKCLIIVNKFENDDSLHLPGYTKDVDNLKTTLKHLNFESEIFEDVKGGKLINTVNKWLMVQDYDEIDAIAFAIFTHGAKEGKIIGCDKKTAKVEDIISLFVEEEQLMGKPKLFFIQACRGTFKPPASTFKPSVKQADVVKRCELADFFVFYSTSEGFVSLVDNRYGSFFIQVLCKVLQAYGGRYSLQEIATKVNHLISEHVVHDGGEEKCQVSEVRHTLTHNVYLYSDGTYPVYKAVDVSENKRALVPAASENLVTNGEVGISVDDLSKIRISKEGWLYLPKSNEEPAISSHESS